MSYHEICQPVPSVLNFRTMEGYKTIKEAAADPKVPYSEDWIAILARRGDIKAEKLGDGQRGVWLVHMPSLYDYIEAMDKLGNQKHSPN